MRPFNLTPEAQQDLREIQDYIAEDNPKAAGKVIDDCFKAFDLLAENPLMGHQREDLTSRKVRFWNCYSYLIIYSAESEPISIVRVLSGYRDITSLL
jgi:plasmid stabilization system protein ParE